MAERPDLEKYQADITRAYRGGTDEAQGWANALVEAIDYALALERQRAALAPPNTDAGRSAMSDVDTSPSATGSPEVDEGWYAPAPAPEPSVPIGQGGTMTNIYIIFDSPPGDGPSNFVEVEDGDGQSLSPEQTGATWQQLGDQSWALGPFARVEPAGGVPTKRLHQGTHTGHNPRRTGP